jgi:hypothetical protein
MAVLVSIAAGVAVEGTTSSAPISQTTRYVAAIYPSPVAGSRAFVPECPSPSGLQSFGSSQQTEARQIATEYGNRSLRVDLHVADRTMWSEIRTRWRTGNHQVEHSLDSVLGVVPAAHESRRGSWVLSSCGAALVGKSLVVIVGPKNLLCVACVTEMFFINRLGHPLLYWVAP